MLNSWKFRDTALDIETILPDLEVPVLDMADMEILYK